MAEYPQASSSILGDLISSQAEGESSFDYQYEPESKAILVAYLKGQLFNVVKTAVWWSMFGVLVISSTQSTLIVLAARGFFNLALIVMSPMTSSVAEFFSIKTILVFTTIGRMIIWALLIPLGWMFIRNKLELTIAFFWIVAGLSFVEGILVAMQLICDVDCGGLDILARQCNIPMNDFTRGRFHYIHHIAFDISFILFTTPIALLFWGFSLKFQLTDFEIFGNHLDGTFWLVFGMGSIFLMLSLFSVWFYSLGIPKIHVSDVIRYDAFLFSDIKSRILDIYEGMKLITQNTPLKWRIFFLAMETAFEDAMVSVVIPCLAFNRSIFILSQFNGVVTGANVAAVATIAFGKLGTSLSSFLLNALWLPTMELPALKKYKVLFWLPLFGSMSIMLVPLAIYITEKFATPDWLRMVLVFTGVFLYFAFSNFTKLGFSSLLDILITNEEVAVKMYSFIGVFVIFMDALVIIFVNLIFYLLRERFFLAFIIFSGTFFFYGIMEAMLGTPLVLRPLMSAPLEG